MDVNLEHILVSAKYRQAPLTPETAGYLALALTDALVGHPCAPGPRQVLVSSDGSVTVQQAPSVQNEQQAVAAVRLLLGYLLSVASGAAPALSACARRREPTTLQALVGELESSLIPVNRDAGRRALARLVREASKASVPAGAKWTPPRTETPSQENANRDLTGSETAPPAADPDDAGPTDVDAPVAPVQQQAPEPSDEDDDLETYEPPPVEGGEDPTLDLLTASPPQVAEQDAETRADDRDHQQPAHASPEQTEQHGIDSENTTAQGSSSGHRDEPGERVQELLAQMEPLPARSTKEVAHELKHMLGLPPTPPPPDASELEDLTSGEDPHPAEPEPSAEPPEASTGKSERRQRRMALGITVTLLVLAVAGLIAVYIAFPGMLFAR